MQGDDTQSTLTDLGREQAAQVREALQDMHFDRWVGQMLYVHLAHDQRS